MELSYSQNLEDHYLSLAFAGQPTGTYVDVGAGHPIADNVSFWFYERGWRGLVVEPQQNLADLYARLRPRDIAYCGLVGRDVGETEFYVVDGLHGFSTMVSRHAHQAKKFGVDHKVVRTPVTTLAMLCESNAIGKIDFLKVDVEGAESDVLAGADWKRFRPKVVLVEAVTPGTGEPSWHEWETDLLTRGYRFALFDTLNRYYVANEHPDIFARLPREQAAWISVRHLYEFGRAPENKQHPDHALTEELARGFWAHLPHLDADTLSAILARGRSITAPQEVERLATEIASDSFRGALGRIACGYDGGQIFE